MYGYGTLKPVEVILKRRWGRGRIMEGMNPTGVQYMHIGKCGNKPPV
jgi:hypothetical protein